MIACIYCGACSYRVALPFLSAGVAFAVVGEFAEGYQLAGTIGVICDRHRHSDEKSMQPAAINATASRSGRKLLDIAIAEKSADEERPGSKVKDRSPRVEPSSANWTCELPGCQIVNLIAPSFHLIFIHNVTVRFLTSYRLSTIDQ
jgi:hypothetical protein